MRRFGIVVGLGVVAMASSAAHARGEPEAVANAMKAEIKATPSGPDETDSEVPAKIRLLLQEVRNALRAMVEVDLTDATIAALKPDALAKHLEAQLTAAGIAVGATNDKATAPKGLTPFWGHIVAVHAWVPAQSPDRLAVDVAWGMPCGTDTTTWLFEKAAGAWKLVLVDESKAFDADNHVFDVVATGPSDFYAFSAHTPVWCTSVWSALRVQVLAPGATPAEPRAQFSTELSANRSCGSVQKLTTKPTDISFQYVGAQVNDPATPQLYEVKLRVDKKGVKQTGKPRAVKGEPCP